MLLEIIKRWRSLAKVVPYNRALGLTLGAAEEEWCTVEIPYQEDLVGDPETGVLHGGVVTALIDVAFGFAVFHRTKAFRQMATLDLRIDYLKPATPGKTLVGGGVCYKVTSQLAFVRGAAYHETPGDPVSTGVGIFMFTDATADTRP